MQYRQVTNKQESDPDTALFTMNCVQFLAVPDYFAALFAAVCNAPISLATCPILKLVKNHEATDSSKDRIVLKF
jgi:hypothetical protein